jgi:predicted Zn-dependent protease
MEDAVIAWNAKTSTTKVHFQAVEYTDPADIMFELNNAQVASAGSFCARGMVGGKVFFESALNNIGENPTDQINGRSKRELIAHILKHELGHVMNLDHETGTIMEQASAGGTNCSDVVQRRRKPPH